MSRTEHLQWCKKRALEYASNGDLTGAYASMISDMQKHSETKNHPAIRLGMMLLMAGKLDTQSKMEKFIEGFN